MLQRTAGHKPLASISPPHPFPRKREKVWNSVKFSEVCKLKFWVGLRNTAHAHQLWLRPPIHAMGVARFSKHASQSGGVVLIINKKRRENGIPNIILRCYSLSLFLSLGCQWLYSGETGAATGR